MQSLKNLRDTIEGNYFSEYYRWVHWLPVGLIFGISLYFSLAQEPGLLAYVGVFCLGISGLILAITKPSTSFFCYLITGFSVGFCLTGAKINFNPTPMFKSVQEKAEIGGKIAAIENHPYRDDGTYRVIVEKVSINQKSFSAKLRLNIPQNIGNTLAINDKILVAATIYPIPMPNSLHGYFARRAAFLQGIAGTGSANALIGHQKSANTTLTHYRHILTQKLRARLAEPYSAIAAALVTGDRSYIGQELRQAFADAGLAHILAISGLHLSLVTLLVFLIARRLLCLWPRFAMAIAAKKVAAVLAVFASLFYMTIANFGIPVQRSFIMITLAMLAICLDRTAFSMRSLVLAATIILLLSPESLLSASFQLSFAAVLGLLAFYESAWLNLQEKIFQDSSKYLGAKKLFWGFLGICMTTLIASLATTPFSIAFFQRFTAQAILGNLLAIPLVGFVIMPLGLACICSLALGKSETLFWLWEKSLMVLCEIAKIISKLPGASIQVKAVPYDALIIFSIGMLWICLWKRSWRWLGLLPIVIAVITWRVFELPFAYVSAKNDLMAYLDNDVVYISSPKYDSFLVDAWSQEWGVCAHKIWKTSFYHRNEAHLLLASSPKDALDYLRRLNENQKIESLVTFGYAKTLKKHNFKIPQIIDRTSIQHEGGVAVYLNPLRFCFLKRYFGSRPWCVG